MPELQVTASETIYSASSLLLHSMHMETVNKHAGHCYKIASTAGEVLYYMVTILMNGPPCDI